MSTEIIGVDWVSLIPAFLYIRILLFTVGTYLLIDTACLVGFLDGPKISWCFKLMTGWMAGASIGLMIFSWAGDESMMFIFSAACVFGLSLMRLWTWLKGFHLSKFVAGEQITMINK